MIIRKKVFLASSNELSTERDRAELVVLRRNGGTVPNGLLLDVIRWEELSHAMCKNNVQDRFSEALKESDAAVFLFGTRVGPCTDIEFRLACSRFRAGENPKHIVVFFKNIRVSTPEIDAGILDVQRKREELRNDGQLYEDFDGPKDLELLLGKQLNHIVAQFEADAGILAVPEEAIQREAAMIPVPGNADAERKLSKREVGELARRIGLLSDWRKNGHLRFQDGDISYFAEQDCPRWRLEIWLRARLLVLQEAEEKDMILADPGDLSAKAKLIEPRLESAWRQGSRNSATGTTS